MEIDPNPGYLRIATEEAWAPVELIEMYRKAVAAGSVNDPGFNIQWGFFNRGGDRARLVLERIQDLGERRLSDMDAAGISKAVISLTCPGVQIFDPAVATDLSVSFNDQLAGSIASHPERLTGLATIAPQEPGKAAKELQRAVIRLGLKGAIVNSHTMGEYLDDPKYWDIFAAAQELDVPIYLHPNTPPKSMIEPFMARGLEGAALGFAVEAGLHALRLVVSGVFDHFPRLQVVLGHLGEGLPFWLSRLDFIHGGNLRNKRYGDATPQLSKPVSTYLRENFYYTTSGMSWSPAIQFTHQVIGAERLMYAMDYPYQYVLEEVAEQDALPFSDADKRLFFEGNAKRLFKIDQ